MELTRYILLITAFGILGTAVLDGRQQHEFTSTQEPSWTEKRIIERQQDQAKRIENLATLQQAHNISDGHPVMIERMTHTLLRLDRMDENLKLGLTLLWGLVASTGILVIELGIRIVQTHIRKE